MFFSLSCYLPCALILDKLLTFNNVKTSFHCSLLKATLSTKVRKKKDIKGVPINQDIFVSHFNVVLIHNGLLKCLINVYMIQ